ncbi:MAG: Mobile element protein [uncultured Paraburkholderia sp.]|nr:MAG: Mobile element protein [uncultured Paraburkholderia sp.]
MRQIHRAGEKLFVDFAGPTLPLASGRRAHIFVAAIPMCIRPLTTIRSNCYHKRVSYKEAGFP